MSAALTVVATEHVRALCALGDRTVLVLGADGLRIVTPDQADEGALEGRYRVLCT